MDKCCFCVNVELGSHCVALIELTLALPLVIHGLATLNLPIGAIGLLLTVSAWVIFDGVYLGRKSLLTGWLAITVLKISAGFAVGTLLTFLAMGEVEEKDIRGLMPPYVNCIYSGMIESNYLPLVKIN